MDFKKLVPWNWFNKEEWSGQTVPIHESKRGQGSRQGAGAIEQLTKEMDYWADNFLKRFGREPFGAGNVFSSSITEGLLKPTVDIGANNKEYDISVEIPGVDQKDVTLEISDNTLVIRGEKKLQQEKKEKNYYRMERSYGAFQRILSLPEDADPEGVKATFKNGVLSVTFPRRALPDSVVKQIEIT